MRARLLGLSLLFGLGFQSAEAATPRTVRVDLFQAHRPLHQIKIWGPVQMVQPLHQTLPHGFYTSQATQGQVLFGVNSNAGQVPRTALVKTHRLVLAASGAGSISIKPAGLKARQYSGRITLSVDSQRALRVVNELSARDYVTLVVGSETPPNWPVEALKAQAVLTQTRLARYHAGDALSDTTQGEVYLGNAHRRPDVSRAVAQVWGQVLMYQDFPITAFYHASCAGHTSDTRVFGQHQRLPGIKGVACGACKMAHFARPTTTVISRIAWLKAFPEGLPQTLSVDAAGRPLVVRFDNGKSESGYAFWLALGQKLGWDKAPGLRFSWAEDAKGNVRVTSCGAGHGVGLCQHGAAQMARQGKTYWQILDYYFPEAKLIGAPEL